MHSKHITAALALLAVPALSFATTQDVPKAPKAGAGQPAAQDQKAPHFGTVSKLIGMNVYTRATADGDRKDIADVRDLIVDGSSGAVTHVVLSSGGVGSVGDTLRLRPFSDLRFDRANPKEPKIWLDVTEADFEASAKITNDALEVYQCKAIAEAHAGHAARLREASAPKDAVTPDERMTLLVLASELDDFDVRTTAGSAGEKSDAKAGDSVGSINEAWIECPTGNVAFLTVEHNKRMVVLPMSALVATVDPAKKTVFFATPCTIQQLAAAPAIDEKAGLTLDNAEFRKSIAEYHGRLKPAGGKSAGGAGSNGRE